MMVKVFYKDSEERHSLISYDLRKHKVVAPTQVDHPELISSIDTIIKHGFDELNKKPHLKKLVKRFGKDFVEAHVVRA